MDAELIRRWNEAVRPYDLVVHLGDFALASVSQSTAEQAQSDCPGQPRPLRDPDEGPRLCGGVS